MDKHVMLYTFTAYLLAYCLYHCIVHLHKVLISLHAATNHTQHPGVMVPSICTSDALHATELLQSAAQSLCREPPHLLTTLRPSLWENRRLLQ